MRMWLDADACPRIFQPVGPLADSQREIIPGWRRHGSRHSSPAPWNALLSSPMTPRILDKKKPVQGRAISSKRTA